MVTIPGLEGMSLAPIAGQMAYWFSIFLIMIVLVVGFIVIYYFISFPINATVFPMYGSGKDNVLAVGARKKNKVKWINHRTAWRSMYPLFNKVDRDPFDSEYIYPGKGKKKEVYVFDFNDQWSPGRININQTEEEIRAKINPVPYHVRNWQSLQHKKNAIEFAKTDFWTENKGMFIMLGVVLFNLVLCGTVIYLTYKYAGGGREDARMISDAIRGFAGAGGQAVNMPG